MPETDARTTALRERAFTDASYFGHHSGTCDKKGICKRSAQLYSKADTALDALTQHHEVIGAVKALEEFWPDRTSVSPDVLAQRYVEQLAAWRKRLEP